MRTCGRCAVHRSAAPASHGAGARREGRDGAGQGVAGLQDAERASELLRDGDLGDRCGDVRGGRLFCATLHQVVCAGRVDRRECAPRVRRPSAVTRRRSSAASLAIASPPAEKSRRSHVMTAIDQTGLGEPLPFTASTPSARVRRSARASCSARRCPRPRIRRLTSAVSGSRVRRSARSTTTLRRRERP